MGSNEPLPLGRRSGQKNDGVLGAYRRCDGEGFESVWCGSRTEHHMDVEVSTQDDHGRDDAEGVEEMGQDGHGCGHRWKCTAHWVRDHGQSRHRCLIDGDGIERDDDCVPWLVETMGLVAPTLDVGDG